MRTKIFSFLALGLAISAGSSEASVVYDNTTTDTFVTYFYSTGPFTEIGDSITLGGTERSLTSADVQFFNGGSSGGSFTATLRFYDTSFNLLGSSYAVNVGSISAFDILTVTFGGLNLVAPDNLIFTVAVSSLSSGLDLGLNAFEPPTVGFSNSASLIVGNGGVLLSGDTERGEGNLYFLLNADRMVSPVPEPGTMALLGIGFAGLGLVRRRS